MIQLNNPPIPIFKWVHFNGTGTVAILASSGVSSITDRGAGQYTVNFTNPMPDVNYSFAGSCGGTNGNNTVNQTSAGMGTAPSGAQKSVSACQIYVSATPGVNADAASVSAIFIR